jgi:aryl-alcohol dehydrogenase-like predicted oxidoreductase
MDYVDLLQIHRWDYSTPIEETLEALDEVVTRRAKSRRARPTISSLLPSE